MYKLDVVGPINNKPSTNGLHHLKLDGVAPLIADPPPLKLHQQAKSTLSVKWP